MPSAIQLQLLETFRGVAIVGGSYPERILFTPEVDQAQAFALLELPFPVFAVVLDQSNISNASGYGPEEEARTKLSPPFPELRRRLITLVRFRSSSFTSLIHSMRANLLLRGGLSACSAPDAAAAIRAARRAIEHREAERQGAV